MQLVKPRARPAYDRDDVPCGWLVHGMGFAMYSIVSLDRALHHWYQAAIKKISNPIPTQQ